MIQFISSLFMGFFNPWFFVLLILSIFLVLFLASPSALVNMAELNISAQSTHTTTDIPSAISFELTWPSSTADPSNTTPIETSGPVSTTERLPIESTASSWSQAIVVVPQTQTDASTFRTSTSTNTSSTPTSNSTYDGANATSTPPAQAQPTGFSAGSSAGIGVGVAIGVLLLALAVFLMYRYNRKRRVFAQEASAREDPYPELPELAIDGQKYELEAEDNEKPAELAGDRPKNGQTETHTHELE